MDIVENINKRIIDPTMYEYDINAPDSLSLTDIVVCFKSNTMFKIIPINIFHASPIIYDKLNITDGEQTHLKDISIVVCPFTYAATVFEGKLICSGIDRHVIELEDKKGNSVKLLKGAKDFNTDDNIFRASVEIKTYRVALSEHLDAQYMIIKKHFKPLIDPYYYSSKIIVTDDVEELFTIHPKTLVRLVIYKSSEKNKTKFSIVVGKDANSSTVTGFNAESGFSEYEQDMSDKLVEKSAFIIPIMWFCYKDFYPDAKVILL